MRTNEAKPITLGIMDSLAYMNEGRLPQRSCVSCALFRMAMACALVAGIATGLVIFVEKLV